MLDFNYHRAKDLNEILDVLATQRGRAWLLAGGTDLMVDMRAGKISPRFVLDIGGVTELAGIQLEGNNLWIGSGTKLAEVAESPLVARYAGVLAQAAIQVGSPQIRNQATMGGNLMAAASLPPCSNRPRLKPEQACDQCVRQCQMDQPGPPVYGDTATALMALDARVCLTSTTGTRTLDMETFLDRPPTERRATELVHGLLVPLRASTARGYYAKIGMRRALSVSLFNVAVVVDCQGGHCQDICIAMGQMGPRVRRALAAEEVLKGQRPTHYLMVHGAALAEAEGEPISDIRATAEYRRRLCRHWTELALRAVLAPTEP